MPPDDDGWEDVKGGLGEKIDWADDTSFTGTYLGPITAQDKEGADLEAFAFSHEGTEYFAWSSYQLAEALNQVAVGNLVQINYLGKREMSNGQTVNLFKVRHKAGDELVSTVVAAQPQLGVCLHFDEEPF